MFQTTTLPFKVDQIVEVKSFEKGYRRAWFRCKILNIYTERNNEYYDLEYLDFPDEETHKTKVYQIFQRKTQLMIRPPYPPHYHETEVDKIKNDVKPLLVIHESFEVGDLVDWWEKDCYWSGNVTELKENETVQIELLPKPVGEGGSYEALCKKLRPSLDWSLESGWEVPSTICLRQCAKLVKREAVCETGKEHTERITITQQLNGELRLNIMESDLIEAALYDLEEIVVRIEWLQEMLRPDDGEAAKSFWKYEDYRPSSSGM